MTLPVSKTLKIVLISITILSIVWIFLFPQPIKIGVIISTDTAVGSEENLALKFFKDQFQKIGTRRVEFLVENPSLKKKDIENAFQELQKEKVCAIIGGSVSYSGRILSELAESSKIPVLTLSVTTSILDKKKDNLYKFMLSTEIRGKYLSKYLEKNKFKNLVVVSSNFNSEFSDTYIKSIEKYFKGNILKIPIGKLELEKDKTLNIIRTFKPDAFFLLLQSNDLVKFILETKDSFTNQTFISSLWALDIALANLESDILKNLIFISEYKNTGDFSRDPLIKKFEDLYGFKSSFATFNTLNVMKILFSAIKEVGADRENLIDYLNQPRRYLSNGEEIYLNEYGDAFKDWVYFFKYKNGNFELIDKIDVKEIWKGDLYK